MTTLETAVERKMADQTEFVRWWDEAVAPNRHSHAPDRSLRAATSVDQAEEQTGITKQQVSKWRRRFKEPEKYAAMLYGAAAPA